MRGLGRAVVVLLMLAFAISACTSSKPRASRTPSISDEVTLRTDSQTYAPGGRPKITLVNGSDSEVGYNLCFAFLELERLDGGTWKKVSKSLGPGGNVDCTAELRLLAPGAMATGQPYLPSDLEPGTYRLVHKAEINRERTEVATNAFEVS